MQTRARIKEFIKSAKRKIHLGFAQSRKFAKFSQILAKEKADPSGSAFIHWSSLRESNPYNQLGKLVFYH